MSSINKNNLRRGVTPTPAPITGTPDSRRSVPRDRVKKSVGPWVGTIPLGQTGRKDQKTTTKTTSRLFCGQNKDVMEPKCRPKTSRIDITDRLICIS